jgi:hypothetical protein
VGVRGPGGAPPDPHQPKGLVLKRRTGWMTRTGAEQHRPFT